MRKVIAYLFLAGCSAAPPTPPTTAQVTPATLQPGQAAFESTCAVCHQASGSGVPGTFPPLAGSEWVNGPPEIPIAVVLRGAQGSFKVGGMTYSGSMPPHRDTLKDDQIAEILSYVRSSWGNSASPVTAAQVATLRKSHAQGEPWSEAELRKTFR